MPLAFRNRFGGDQPSTSAQSDCKTASGFLSFHKRRRICPVGLNFVVTILLLSVVAQVRAQRPMGTDVSSYQGGSLNWTTLKNTDGLSFAWTKATEGTYYQDADFAVNENNAKAAGVLIGAYHFARPADDPNITGANSADTEAAYFWSFASGYIKSGYLVPMLDWEDVYVTNNKSLTASVMSQWVNEWCNDVSNDIRSATGFAVKPVVYTGSWYSTPGTYPGLNSTVKVWPTWVSDYPHCTGNACGDASPQTDSPVPAYPWSTWNIWQYGDTNWSGGDSDVFNGTAAQFQQLFLIGSSPIPTTASLYWDPGLQKSSPGTGGTGTWDGSSTNWWYTNTTDTVWPPLGSYAVFAGTPGTVTLNASETATGLVFQTNGYVLSGANTLLLSSPATISVPTGMSAAVQCVLGGAAFSLSGGGSLTLNNSGNYSAGETVTGPKTTLIVPTEHPLGNDGVTLNLLAGGTYQNNDTVSGDQFLLPGCAVALGTGGGIFSNPSNNLTMTNYITGSGSLTVAGTSFTLTLTDTANNYSGGTILQSGTLKANAAGVLGATTGALTVYGGTLNLNAASFTVGPVTITNGTIQNGTLTGSSYSGQGGTISAVLAGTGNLAKIGTNTLILSGPNTYSGVTTVAAGVLQISADNNLGAAPGSPTFSKLNLNGGGNLRASSSFTLSPNRGITLGGGGGVLQAASGVTLTYGGVMTGNGSFSSGASITVGYGTVILSGSNTYTGGTTIACGTLTLGANGTLPYSTPLTIAASDSVGGTFNLNGFSQTIGPLASSPGIGGTGTVTPTINLTGALTVNQTNVDSVFSGNIIGAGGSLTKTGAATLTLAGTNTYGGATFINSGTLALGPNGSVNNTSSLNIAAGATFDVSAQPACNLGGIHLVASGTAVAATINGGTTINLGSSPITLNYDGADPALTIAQGSLSLGGNAITVNGSVLPAGVYPLILQGSGNISSTGNFALSGTALPAPASGAISQILVSGNTVLLTVAYNTIPVTVAAPSVLPNGSVQLSFSGTPNFNYIIESATNLTPPITWTPLSTNTADTNGNFSFTDTNAVNLSQQFYQTVAQ
jgi:autotransporter-associated beta strand protein